MQVNDFKNIQETIKYEVLQDEKEYLKLLKVIGNKQKYDFSSQLSTVSYTHLTLPTKPYGCRSRWSPYH